MKKCLILFGVAVTSVHVAFAAHQLSLNTLGEFVVSDDAGTAVKTLAHGSVGEVVRSPEQSFKISYGKDLQGNPTTIIYANPEDPQPLNLSYNGKSINLSKDAVLTMVHDANGVILQSGVLGQVTVDGTPMAPSSHMRISNSGTVMASSSPIAPVSATPSSVAMSVAPSSSVSAPVSTQGGVAGVRRVKETPIETGIVVGRVFISNDGGPEEPLTDSSIIKVGSVIRTEPGASATLHLFPDTGTYLHEKSMLGIKSYAFDDTPGAPNRHVILHLYKGKVHNDLNVKGNGTTHYQVDTQHQNFVAIGTNFLVTVDDTEETAFVQVYEGTVGDNEGRKIHARVEGLYTNTGRPPEYTPMSDDQRREYEHRRYGYGNRNGAAATGAATTPDGYVKHDEHKENLHKLHMYALQMNKARMPAITPYLSGQ